MNRLLLQPAFLISSVFILALVAGGVYVSVRIHNDEASKDELVRKAEQLATGHASADQVAAELAQARKDARQELERLNLFINYPTSPEALVAVREEVYDDVLLRIANKVDRLAQDLKQNTSPASPAQVKIREQIAIEQAQIKKALDEWKKLVSDPAANSAPGAAAQALVYAAEIRQDIQDLKKLIDQLTPDNSGLTPAEIVADKNTIDQAIKDANQAVSDLGQTTVPPSVIQQQRQDVTDAQNHVADLQHQLDTINNPPPGNTSQTPPPQTPVDTSSGGGDTSGTSGGSTADPSYVPPSDPNYPGTRYVPPVVSPDPNKPKLIEGQNPNQ